MDQRLFRDVLGRYATGVAIATAATPQDKLRVGLTINSLSSVSLDPPLVLFCLDTRSQTLPIFEKAKGFAINLLRADQQELSRVFAQRGQGDDRWLNLPTTTSAHTDAPLITDCLAQIDCSLEAIYAGGDHMIIVGRVESLWAAEEGQPLLYWRSAYRKLDVS